MYNNKTPSLEQSHTPPLTKRYMGIKYYRPLLMLTWSYCIAHKLKIMTQNALVTTRLMLLGRTISLFFPTRKMSQEIL